MSTVATTGRRCLFEHLSMDSNASRHTRVEVPAYLTHPRCGIYAIVAWLGGSVFIQVDMALWTDQSERYYMKVLYAHFVIQDHAFDELAKAQAGNGSPQDTTQRKPPE